MRYLLRLVDLHRHGRLGLACDVHVDGVSYGVSTVPLSEAEVGRNPARGACHRCQRRGNICLVAVGGVDNGSLRVDAS